MGVMVKDMAMPCSCWECNFLSMEAGLYIDYICECVQRSVDNEIVVKGKPDWCPLEEVPTPHGDLVDLDEIEVNYWEDADGFHESIEATIVIQAEGE
jgi:hypothetical protein